MFMSLILTSGGIWDIVFWASCETLFERRKWVGKGSIPDVLETDAICEHFPEHLPEFVVSVNTGMRLTEQYSCTWSQVDLKRRAIDLTETKNGTARTIHLNPDALAVIESVRLPGRNKQTGCSPGWGATTVSIPAHGSSRAWRRPRLPGMSGTATGTRSVAGWQWLEQPSKRFRNWPGTRPLRWRPGTPTWRQTTNCQ